MTHYSSQLHRAWMPLVAHLLRFHNFCLVPLHHHFPSPSNSLGSTTRLPHKPPHFRRIENHFKWWEDMPADLYFLFLSFFLNHCYFLFSEIEHELHHALTWVYALCITQNEYVRSIKGHVQKKKKRFRENLKKYTLGTLWEVSSCFNHWCMKESEHNWLFDCFCGRVWIPTCRIRALHLWNFSFHFLLWLLLFIVVKVFHFCSFASSVFKLSLNSLGFFAFGNSFFKFLLLPSPSAWFFFIPALSFFPPSISIELILPGVTSGEQPLRCTPRESRRRRTWLRVERT